MDDNPGSTHDSDKVVSKRPGPRLSACQWCLVTTADVQDKATAIMLLGKCVRINVTKDGWYAILVKRTN